MSSSPSPPPPPPSSSNKPAVAGQFRHKLSSLVIKSGAPNHRGRDVLVIAGQPQNIEAKFAYGKIDKDLKDEDVLIEHVKWRELEGNAGDGEIETIATIRTTRDDDVIVSAVAAAGQSEGEGVECDGGRVRFTIPPERALPVGRHRIRFTVLGDGSTAEIAVVVVPRDQPVFVSDVDGTLTASEIAEFPALAVGKLPLAHPHAAIIFQKLAARGLVPIYLTARPEWLMARTRAFLEENQFPKGIVCTQRNKSGGYGSSAAAFKKTELERIVSIGVRIDWAFGNMPSDAHAYASIVADARRRILLRQDDATFGARRIESYEELLAELTELTELAG